MDYPNDAVKILLLVICKIAFYTHPFHIVVKGETSPLKGQSGTGLNLFQNERVKFFKQNSEKFDENRLKNNLGSYDTFNFSQIFTISCILTISDMQYAKWVSWWCHRLVLLAIYGTVHKILKILIFCPNFWLNCIFPFHIHLGILGANIILHAIHESELEAKGLLISHRKKYEIFEISVYKMNGKLWGDDIINSHIVHITYRLVKKCFIEKFAKLHKCA